MKLTKNDVRLAWPISLIGLPLICIILVSIFGLSTSIYSNKYLYILSISGSLLLVVFAIFNMIFSFITLSKVWVTLATKEKIKYLAICLFTNALSGFVMVKFWTESGINIFSFADNKKLDTLSFAFYFFTSVSILIPIFIANRQF